MVWMLLLLSVIVLVLYVYQSEQWLYTWNQSPDLELEDQTEGPLITVVVAYRNEAPNLPVLLNSLKKQGYKHWELVLVNDHSEDAGLSDCMDMLSSFPVQVYTLNNQEEGKKQALLTGAKAAKGELIVTTDADCVFDPDWLNIIAQYYQINSPELMIGPVRQLEDDSVLSRFQAVEFIALQISGGAAALKQQAIMLNGANLACKKAVYLEARLNNRIASGDDMFLLEWVKKRHLKIEYLKSSKAIVYTKTEKTISKLLKQKSRWALKARHYTDRKIITTGSIVFFVNLLQLVLMITGIINSHYVIAFLGLFVVRLITDIRLIQSGSYFFTYLPCIRQLIVFQLIYPLYMLLVMVYPLFFSLKWKGRKIRT